MSYKNETNRRLLEYYDKNGYLASMLVARKMMELRTNKNDEEFHSLVHGEICETVLEIILLEYIKKNKLESKGWFISKGLILKDVDNPKSDYLTELDVTLFTPQMIFAFECKSYGGDKELRDKCTIIRKKYGKMFDVYNQHEKHMQILLKNLEPFRMNKDLTNVPFKLGLFNYSLGKTEDNRTSEWKKIMPCVDESNVLDMLKDIDKSPVLWNINYVKRVVDIIESKMEENTAKHLNYVKSIRR